MSKGPELVLFDLDGTLIDSAPDLAVAVNTSLEQAGKAQHDAATIRDWIGNGIETLIHRAITGSEDVQAEASEFKLVFELFLQAYKQQNGKHSAVYPGVMPALQHLQQHSIAMGVVTNKRGRFSEPLLKDKQLYDYFELIVSGDTLAQKKPDPAPLQYAAEHFAAQPAHSIMVGDSINDVLAGQAAGFKTLCVSYGYHRDINLSELNPDWLVDSLLALPDIIQNYDS